MVKLDVARAVSLFLVSYEFHLKVSLVFADAVSTSFVNIPRMPRYFQVDISLCYNMAQLFWDIFLVMTCVNVYNDDFFMNSCSKSKLFNLSLGNLAFVLTDVTPTDIKQQEPLLSIMCFASYTRSSVAETKLNFLIILSFQIRVANIWFIPSLYFNPWPN